MKIKPYFKTKLAKPFQGKHHHPAGASVVMNSSIETKSIGKFIITIPDPVSLNFNNAANFIEKSEKIKQRIDKSKKVKIFSKNLNENTIKSLSIEQIKASDKDVKIFRDLENDKVFDYIQATMGIVISLIAAVESFLNMIIPFDYEIKKEGKILDKNKIVRKFSIEDKIELVGKIKNKTNTKQESFWNSFKTVKKLRDDIIHFKKTTSKVDELWTPIIILLFDSDFNKIFSDFVDLINYLEPSYLEEDK